ncbi:hypothetical protein SDC9_78403 [bioreactor metagenome]|uniref:Uncharacterized protein n=1 Tax=bioreactor metagenome TaxID=1076179 RepID=A0A644YTK7_9ZZZZ
MPGLTKTTFAKSLIKGILLTALAKATEVFSRIIKVKILATNPHIGFLYFILLFLRAFSLPL